MNSKESRRSECFRFSDQYRKLKLRFFEVFYQHFVFSFGNNTEINLKSTHIQTTRRRKYVIIIIRIIIVIKLTSVFSKKAIVVKNIVVLSFAKWLLVKSRKIFDQQIFFSAKPTEAEIIFPFFGFCSE
jgi:hypothetical protein